jgi:uncharacterized membrane protein
MKLIHTTRNVLRIALVILSTLSLVQAQEAKPLPRHPGDVIKYRITFDGPNADKIKMVYARMNITAQIPKDQAGFTSQFNTAGQIQPSSPKTFDIEMKIPDNTATGEWRLHFTATATEGSAEYEDGQEFNVPNVQVDNPRTFTPPAVKVAPPLP